MFLFCVFFIDVHRSQFPVHRQRENEDLGIWSVFEETQSVFGAVVVVVLPQTVNG